MSIMPIEGILEPESKSGARHITLDIQVWQNSATNVRVVDVPGFADTAANPMLIH